MVANVRMASPGGRLALLMASIGLLADACPGAGPPGRSLSERYWATRKPNVIVVVADGLDRSDLGCYGRSPAATPAIDQLAAEGMRFTQAYAGSPDDLAARASLMLGQDARRAAVRAAATSGMPSNAVTLAEVLRPAGYLTAAVGVWGLGEAGSAGPPNAQGFQEWLGYLSLEQAKDAYPTQLWRNADILIREQNFYGYRGEYAPDLLIRGVTNFIRTSRLRPFFLYFAPPLPGATDPSPAPAGGNRAARLSRLNADIASLMDQIRRLALEKYTVVFFTSTPRARGATAAPAMPASPARPLSEAGLRVPLIAWGPGRIPAGTVTDQVFAAWDLLPTVAAMAQTNAPSGVDGLSLDPTLRGNAQTNQHAFLYWETSRDGKAQAVRQGNYKGVRAGPGQPLRVYRLDRDPRETNDVAAVSGEVVRGLEAVLRQAGADPAGRGR